VQNYGAPLTRQGRQGSSPSAVRTWNMDGLDAGTGFEAIAPRLEPVSRGQAQEAYSSPAEK
jgi:hypothetical protein